MHFQSIFVTLLLSTVVAAKGQNATKAVSDKTLCKEMATLSQVVALAANTTKLDAIAKNNATKIAEYEAKAATAETTLTAMQVNTTLVQTCAVIAAAATTEKDCASMKSLQKSIDLAANATELAAKAKGNATKEAELKNKATTAQTKLAALTSNTTLVSVCDSVASEKNDTAAASASSTSAAAVAATTSATSGASSLVRGGEGMALPVLIVVAGMMML